jgi:hypothetical protein
MSESAIETIYREISKMTISKVKARNIDKVKLTVNQKDLPMRMLLPSTQAEHTFVGFGTLNRLTWVIRDLCLWAPIKSGSSIEKHAGSMVSYIKLYIDALKSNRNPTLQSNIMGVTFSMGPIPWGDGDFWAIDTTLTVEEIL